MIKNVTTSSFRRRIPSILNWFLLALFLAFVIRRVLFWFSKDALEDRLNFWAFTDWLIDYSSGFTRRGLSGEFINMLSAVAPPKMIVAVLSWLIFLAVVLGYLRMLSSSVNVLNPFTMAGMLFLPSLLLFYVYDHDAFARKEIIGYAILLWHLVILERAFPASSSLPPPAERRRRYIRDLLPLSLIALPAFMLIHEASFLLFIPSHAAITFSILRTDSPKAPLRTLGRAALLYLPSALIFTVIFIFGRPTFDMAHAICEKWEAVRVLESGSCIVSNSGLLNLLPGAFNSLSWSLPEAASFTLGFSAATFTEWILVILLLGLCLWYIVWHAVFSGIRFRFPDASTVQSAERYAGTFCIHYFLFPFLFSLPVYIMGWDIGRWFAVTSINFALLGASIPLQSREFGLSGPGGAEEYPAIRTGEKGNKPILFYTLSIVILLTALYTRLPHCCITPEKILTGPLQAILHTFFPP
jgi:hypothetical protein